MLATITSELRLIKNNVAIWLLVLYAVFVLLGGQAYIARVSGLSSLLDRLFDHSYVASDYSRYLWVEERT